MGNRKPHTIEIEKSLLGAILLDHTVIDDVDGLLSAEDFSVTTHGNLFGLLQSFRRQRKYFDSLVLVKFVTESNTQKYGDITSIGALGDVACLSFKATHYATTIKEASIRRKMMSTSNKLVQSASDPNMELDELIESAQKDLMNIAGNQSKTDWHTGAAMAIDAQSRWEQRVEQNKNPNTVKLTTGIPELDKKLCSLDPGLILLAARPSMGKTAMALNIAVEALRSNIPVGFFSLEMDRGALIDRVASSLSGVDSSKIRSGSLNVKDWDKLDSDALEFIHNAPFYVHDESGISVAKISAKARRLKSMCPELGLIIVDYLQLIKQPNAESVEQSVAQISTSMKILSRNLSIPVLCLAQLNRGCEARTNKRPKLSDLRGSGSLEQDADVAIFLYRHHYYDPKANPHHAEAIIAKQRNGPTGTVLLDWDAQHQKFSDRLDAVDSYIKRASYRKRADIDDVYESGQDW